MRFVSLFTAGFKALARLLRFVSDRQLREDGARLQSETERRAAAALASSARATAVRNRDLSDSDLVDRL